jgi:hypothetical protein
MILGRLFLFLFLALNLALPSAARAKNESALASLEPCANLYAGLFSAKDTVTGPRVYLHAGPGGLRDFDSINELKVGQFNVENMYNYRGKWERNPETNGLMLVKPPFPKPEARWRHLQDVITRSDDDIMIWEEVEDFTAAKDFIDSHLGGRYKVIVIEGNDERGIDIAVLVKKDLPFDVEVQSYKNISYDKDGNKLKVFSRDLPVVSVRKAGAPESDKPIARFVGTHYKSMQDSKGDPKSVLKRTRQVEQTTKILGKYEQTNPNVPIFLMGDFNADLRTGQEFKPLWKAGYKDSFDLVPNPLPKDMRRTHSYLPEGEEPVYGQLDGVLVNKAGQDNLVKSAKIIPYKNADGTDMPLPRTHDERELQGSDHRKLQIVLDFKKMRENWQRP